MSTDLLCAAEKRRLREPGAVFRGWGVCGRAVENIQLQYAYVLDAFQSLRLF